MATLICLHAINGCFYTTKNSGVVITKMYGPQSRNYIHYLALYRKGLPKPGWRSRENDLLHQLHQHSAGAEGRTWAFVSLLVSDAIKPSSLNPQQLLSGSPTSPGALGTLSLLRGMGNLTSLCHCSAQRVSTHVHSCSLSSVMGLSPPHAARAPATC